MELEQVSVWEFRLEVQGLSGWWAEEFNLCMHMLDSVYTRHAKLNNKDLKDELAKISSQAFCTSYGRFHNKDLK